jgi:ergothioneine biosynthesis protein EgtB
MTQSPHTKDRALQDTQDPGIHSPQIRHAGHDWLSLALMDARNHTLRWSGVFEAALAGRQWQVPTLGELSPPLWELGHIGWFQEAWIARNVQRQRGPAADPSAPRLASIEPQADRWYDPDQVLPARRWTLDLPGLPATKQYLADTIEVTLELLSGTDDSDPALYFYRLALFHEDLRGEALAVAAQTLGLPLGSPGDPAAPGAGLALDWPTQAPREPVCFPATRWTLGSPDTGFVFDNERGTEAVDVPEFEVDAQPVSWAQYCEFVEDGGYDEARWWTPAAWAWVQREGRRTPRHVLQMRQAVLQQRFGRSVRVPMAQPVTHVTAFEAEAWCRWAGRRLPSEVEWELAAHQGASRGVRWGQVWEWTASSLRPYAGFEPHPWRAYSQACFGSHRVLRGASPATRGRLRDPKFRRFCLPEQDDGFFGFRSCAA